MAGDIPSGGARSGGSSNKRRKSAKYLSNSTKRKSSCGLRAGLQGFLVTCDKGQERATMKEVINLLDEFYERLVEGGNASVDSKVNNQLSQFPPHVVRCESSGIVESEADACSATLGVASESVQIDGFKTSNFKEEKTTQVDPSGNVMPTEKNTKIGSAKDHVKSIDVALEAELAQLRDKKKARFVGLDTGCAGIVFVEMLKNSSIKPFKIVESIVHTIATSKQSRTRFSLRLLPVEITCYASGCEVKKVAEPVISQYFQQKNSGDGLKFAVVYEARANTTLDRMEIINSVAQLVPKPHFVDLNNPDVSIIVQIIKTTCAIGIAHEFKEMAKYNLKRLVPDKDKV